MIELHLIGYTADLRHLVFDLDEDGGDGRYRVVIDGDLFATLDDIRAARTARGMDTGPYEIVFLDDEGTEPDADVEVALPADEPVRPEDDVSVAVDVVDDVMVDWVPAPPESANGHPRGASLPPDDGEDAPLFERRPPPPTPSRSEPNTVGYYLERARRDADAFARPPDESRPADTAPSVPEPAPVAEPEDVPVAKVEPAERPSETSTRPAPHRPSAAQAPPESRLSPAEIQAQLRAGRSVRAVAKAAGTGAEWVERWLAPIEAERAEILERAWRRFLERPRLGRSREPLGVAVERSLESRNVDPDTVTWDVGRRKDGRWRLTVRFTHRGRARSATWTFDPELERIAPASDVAKELGFTRPDGGGAGKSRATGKRSRR